MARQKQQKSDESKDPLLELEKRYGLQRASIGELTVVSTGSLQLNRAMRIGGTALGKIVELYGPNSCGKSTLCLHQVAEYQKAFPDKKVAYIDFENSFDPFYAAVIGVDVDNLLIYQPDYQEIGFDMVIGLVEKELVSCIVIDSQTAAAPKAVIDGEMGDSTIALQARNNSKFCLKIKGLLSLHKVSLFIVSQTRSNIGGYGGESTITSGGEAIKFYSDVRWKVWKINDKDNEQNKTTVDVVKSKVGKPFGQAKFNIVWGVGISVEGEVLDYGVDFGIIKKSGTWFSYGETKLGQGSETVLSIFKDNPELYEEIKEKVVNKLNNVDVKEESVVELEKEEHESTY